MEMLDKLKSLVGVGAPTMTLTQVSEPGRAGEVLRGTVAVRGGQYDTAIRDIEVHLDEERVVYPTPGIPERQFWRRVAEVVIVLDGRVLQPDEVLELPFELVMPLDLQASGPGVSYRMVANTEIAGLNPRVEQTIQVEAGRA